MPGLTKTVLHRVNRRVIAAPNTDRKKSVPHATSRKHPVRHATKCAKTSAHRMSVPPQHMQPRRAVMPHRQNIPGARTTNITADCHVT